MSLARYQEYRGLLRAVVASSIVTIAACGGGSGGSYLLEATVTGLSGSGLIVKVVANGSSSLLPIRPSENYHTVRLAILRSGSTYSVSVPSSSQPTGPWQTCAVAPATGQISTDVSDVILAITCKTNTYPIAVTVSGLGPAGAYAGLGLQDSLQPNSQPILIDTDGTFPLNASSGQNYQIAVTQQPSPTSTTYPRVYCTVIYVGGSGTITNVSPANPSVVCRPIAQYVLLPTSPPNGGFAALSLDPLSGQLNPLVPGKPVLSALPSPNYSFGPNPGSLVASPCPQFQVPRLFGVVSDPTGAYYIQAWSYGSSGVAVAGSAVPVGTHSQPTLQVDPTGQFLYATYEAPAPYSVYLSGNYLQAFSISRFSGTQQPTPIGSPIFLSDAEQPVQTPFVFVASGTDDLCDYRNWPAGGGTEDVYFEIAPSFLYMYPGGTSSFSVTYTYDPGSSSTLTPKILYPSGQGGEGPIVDDFEPVLTIDPNSRYLVVIDAMDSTQNLYVSGMRNSPITLDSVNKGSDIYRPQAVVFDPSSSYLYVSAANDSGACAIFGYRIDNIMLQLVPLETAAGTGNPYLIAATPCFIESLWTDRSGKYLYAASLRSNQPLKVQVYSLDPNTGLLSAAAPPVSIGAVAPPLSAGSEILNQTGTFDPSGKYLFFYDIDGTLDEYQPLLNPSQAVLSSPINRFAFGPYINPDNFQPVGVYPLE